MQQYSKTTQKLWTLIILHFIKEEIKELNPNLQKISDHPYRILRVGGSRYGKTNALLNLINHERDIDKIYLYAKDPYYPKYQLLINKRENADLKYLNESKALINSSNYMDDIYNKYPNKKRKIWIVSDNMIADVPSNEKQNPIVTE